MIFTFINTAISTHQDKHPRHVHVINIIPDKKGKLFNFKKTLIPTFSAFHSEAWIKEM